MVVIEPVESAKEQGLATEKLERHQTDSARSNQQQSIEELKKALDSLDKDKNRKSQNQQPGSGSQKRQQGEQSAREQQQDSPGKDQQQAAMAQLADDAQDILDEEKQNKKRRKLPVSGGYRDVDRDW